MLRKLLVLGVFAGTSASIPIVYQSNPQAFETLVKSAVQGKAAGENASGLDLTDARIAPPTRQAPGRKVIVQADARGHYAAEFRLNGRQIDALIDTGATLVAINTSTARRAGIPLNSSDFHHQVNTANGTIKAALVNVSSLEIGRIALRDVQAVVLDDKALQTNLIGMSFLKRLERFQSENGTLLLVQ